MLSISGVYKRLVPNTTRMNLALAFLLTLGVLALYVQTLVPSVLDGEPGVYQYISRVPGIPDPSGFPLYVLLGYFWSFLPIGTLAYRMNLLSAFFGALTVGVLFVALRQQELHWLAALGAVLTLALVPPFWEYSILAGKYTLHTFLTVLLFALLVKWENTRQTIWLSSAMLAFGLGLTNNPSFLLLGPATASFVVLVGGRSLLRVPRFFLRSLALVAMPCVLYLYFPLRGYSLLRDNYVLPDWHLAVAQGIVSPYFKESFGGLLQYLTASTFIQTMVRSWQWDTFVGGANIVLQTLSIPIVVISLVGILWLARERRAFALWLTVGVLTFAWIALPYANAVFGTTTDSTPYFLRYFLPGLIALIICAAWGMDIVLRSIPAFLSRFKSQPIIASIVAMVLVSALLITAWWDLYMLHSNFWVDRSTEIQAKWDSIREYPPEQGAAFMGHWGDLTPLWYLQTADGWRRDLVAFFPPTDEHATEWITMGKPLYLAGSLLGWAPNISKRYRLTPWGEIVRVTTKQDVPPSPLSHPTEITYTDVTPQIRLLSYDISAEQVRPGESIQVSLYWQSLATLSLSDYVLGLSLDNLKDEPLTQSFPVTVSWLPGNKLVVDQRALGVYNLVIPTRMKPATYPLRVAFYSIPAGKNLDGEPVAALQIGTIRILGVETAR